MKKRSRSAFSLAELMIGIGILVIMGTVAFVNLLPTRNSKELSQSADRIIAVLNETRDKSMQGIDDKVWGIRFVNPSNQTPYYEMLSDATVTGSRYALPDSIAIPSSSVPLGGAKTIVFARLDGITTPTSVVLYQKNNPQNSTTISVNFAGLVALGSLASTTGVGTPPTPPEYVPPSGGGGIGAWAMTTALLSSIELHSTVAYNGYIYSVAGFNAQGPRPAVLYTQVNGNGTLGSWTTNTSLPSAIHGQSVVVSNGYIYVTGGDTSGNVIAKNDGEKSSLIGSLFGFGTKVALALGGPVPTPAVLYAPIGGNGIIGTWTSTTPMQTSLERHSAVVYNNYIYTTGGYSGAATSSVFYASINGSTGALGAWTSTTPLPSTVYNHSAVAYNGVLYVMGGNVSGSAVPTVSYAHINPDGSIGAWATTTALPSSVWGHSAFTYGGYVYVAGGYDPVGPGRIYSAVLYAFMNADGTLGNWATTTPLQSGLSRHSAVVSNGYVYVTGGRDSSFNRTSTVYYAPLP